MSPLDYLNSLSGLRRVRFLLAAVRDMSTSNANGEKWDRRAHTTHRCQACGKDCDVYVSGASDEELANQNAHLVTPANKANRSALDHAAVCLADQQRADAINAAIRDHGHCMRVLARNAERHGRLMAVAS